MQGIVDGRTNTVALIIGAASLALILLRQRYRPRWPGILMAVVLATGVSALLDLAATAHIAVVGTLPQGLPICSFPR